MKAILNFFKRLFSKKTTKINPLKMRGVPLVWNTQTCEKVKQYALDCFNLTGDQHFIVPISEDSVMIVNSAIRKNVNKNLRLRYKQARAKGVTKYLPPKQISHFEMVKMALFETPCGNAIKKAS